MCIKQFHSITVFLRCLLKGYHLLTTKQLPAFNILATLLVYFQSYFFLLKESEKSSCFCWCILDSSQNNTEGVEALYMKLVFICNFDSGFSEITTSVKVFVYCRFALEVRTID